MCQINRGFENGLGFQMVDLIMVKENSKELYDWEREGYKVEDEDTKM